MISEIVSGIIGGIYDVIRNAMSASTKEKKETIQEHILKNQIVQTRLNTLCSNLHASRVYIIQFHNGGYFYTGLPMQKYSCTFESVAPGVSSQMGEIQNRLVSEYAMLHFAMIKDGEYYVYDTELSENDYAKQKWHEHGIRTYYSAGMWDLGGSKIGNVSVNWNSPHTITPEQVKEVKDFAQMVSGYLINPTTKKNNLVINGVFFTFMAFLFIEIIKFLTDAYHLIAPWLPHLTWLTDALK